MHRPRKTQPREEKRDKKKAVFHNEPGIVSVARRYSGLSSIVRPNVAASLKLDVPLRFGNMEKLTADRRNAKSR